MTLRLSEDSVYPENVIENLVEENERNVKLFLVENFEPGSDKKIVCKFLERRAKMLDMERINALHQIIQEIL